MSPASGLPDPAPLPPYVDPADLRVTSARRMEPPKRMTVAEATAKFYVVHNPGGGTSGPWDPADTPYMVKPMNGMARRRLLGTVFVGPAQGGKTVGLLIGGTVYRVTCDPGDTLVVQTSELMARDFSKRTVSRMQRHSPEVERRLTKDDVLEKHYGQMILSLGYPAIGQLSGRPLPWVLITDRDRMEDDIDGEGEVFDLALKRNQTFGSRGHTCCESSPGKPILKPRWRRPDGSHEAPPAKGILALFNRGDRQLWVWQCPSCAEWFEPVFALLDWGKLRDPAAAAEKTVMICPHRGCVIEPKHKRALNLEGRWLAEGETIDGYGRVSGLARASSIASYWLKGPAAGFQSWGSLVEKYLQALAEYEATGTEQALKTTVNVDQAEPYLPRAALTEAALDAAQLIEAAEPYAVGVAPAGTRFITAAVDVQKASFRVLVMAYVEGLESFVIDAFTIFQTGAGDKARQIAPPQNPGDWDLLVEKVIEKRYPVQGLEGELSIRLTAIDSGGAAGVTSQAYKFWRRMKKRGLDKRFLLTKGGSSINAPRLSETWPDSQRKDRKAAARGEIPVGIFNPNLLKDEVDAGLRALLPAESADEDESGKDEAPRGVPIHLPRAFAEDDNRKSLFEEITAEERRDDGKWVKIGPVNDGFDLLVMNRAAMIRLKAERIDWSKAPAWARPPPDNAYYGPSGAAPPATLPALVKMTIPAIPKRFMRRGL